MEIKDLIKQGKPGRRMPKEQKSLVLVKVRGNILLVLNHPSQVSLALRGHPGALPGSFEDETGILGWFLTELEKDIKVLLEKPQQPQTLQSQESLESEPEPQDEEKQKAIAEGLERLRGHDKVHSATWRPSRRPFKVIKEDKSTSEFRVSLSNQKKRKTEPAQALLGQAFDKAISAALDWAEEEA